MKNDQKGFIATSVLYTLVSLIAAIFFVILNNFLTYRQIQRNDGELIKNKVVTYQIAYHANSGIGTMENSIVRVGERIPLSLNKFTKEGADFIGWARTTTGKKEYNNGQYVQNIGRVPQTTNLYAVWKWKEYTVSFNANGGSNPPANQIKVHNTNLTLSATVPTRAGYTFLGWSENKNATTATYSPRATFTINKNTTLYAIWKLNTYTISYHANGGINPPASQIKTHGVNLTLTSSVPARNGYTFLGWSENKNATTATYSPRATFILNKATTLYAIWKLNTYTVSYHANGGTNPPANQTKTHGVNLTLTSSIPTKSGYTFLGWAEDQTAIAATYSAGGTFTLDRNTTLYAIWKYSYITHASGFEAVLFNRHTPTQTFYIKFPKPFEAPPKISLKTHYTAYNEDQGGCCTWTAEDITTTGFTLVWRNCVGSGNNYTFGNGCDWEATPDVE